MGRYLIHKLLSLIPVLLGISLAAFILGTLSPGSPAELALSQGGYEPTQEQIQAMERHMGLDAPYPVQYLRWSGAPSPGIWGNPIPAGFRWLRSWAAACQSH